MNDSKIAATSRHLAGKRELKEEFAVADRDGDGRVSFEEFKVLLAVFEFFVRRLPDRRSFLLAAGLEQVLDYLEGLHSPTRIRCERMHRHGCARLRR